MSTGTDALTHRTQRHDARWHRAVGVRSLGQVQGSGLRDPAYLMRRPDGQVLQVSELLHLVLMQLTAHRSPEEVAEAVSEAFGRRLTVAGLNHLITTKLSPLGLVTDRHAPAAKPAPRANPLLALRFRVTLLPERTVRRIASVLAPLFWPPVVVVALLALAAMDWMLLGRGSLTGALDQVLATPTFLLVVFGLLTLGALVHETGHAAACHYGGARPGVVGAGVYLVFPAFYTDVTDSYRLDRAGRVRTDLGGLYLNVWCLLVAGGAFLLTGQPALLLVVLIMHIEMAQQLIPTVRFDGYFVLADVAGVPDLFSRVRPVLASLVPGRELDPRVAELRRAARWLVTAWVLVVVPMLTAGLLWLLWHLPSLVRRGIEAISVQVKAVDASVQAGSLPGAALGIVSIVLLAVPLLGIAILLQRLCVLLVRAAGRPLLALRHSPARHHGRGTHGRPRRPAAMPRDISELDKLWLTPAAEPELGPFVQPPPKQPPAKKPSPEQPAATRTSRPRKRSEPPPTLTAAVFTDEQMLGGGRKVPERGWRRAIYSGTSGRLNPGPGAAERREAELLARVRTPIQGSRRVVVMSRKGGVGKTTLTLALGSTFSMMRGDRVVAVDANPDAGNLAHRVAEPNDRTITDVLADIERISSYADLRGYTSQGVQSRLEVLASDDDARISQALDRQAYHRVIDLLDHYYNLIMLDTGTGILDSANQGLLSEADQLVLVLRPALDGARAAALTLDWLTEHEYGGLVSGAVVVVNATRRGVGLPLDKIEDHFAQRCAQVLQIPWDRALERGAQTDLSNLAPATRHALVEVAAAVADNFSQRVSAR